MRWSSRFIPLLGVLILLKSAAGQTVIPAALQPIKKLMEARDFDAAVPQLRVYVEENPQDGHGWYYLGAALHAQQKLPEALKMHLKAAEFAEVKPAALYNAACVHARNQHQDQALTTLQTAIKAGFHDWSTLGRDPDLAALRGDPRFRALLPQVLTGTALFREPTRLLHTLVGEAANDQFGWVARRIGDVDQDGADDFVATAPTAGRRAGKIYVYSSRTGRLRFARNGTPGARLGNSAAAAGDVNADGIPDLIVGAPGSDTAEVLSGHDGALLWKLQGPRSGISFGENVTGVVDLDADGHSEFAVTAVAAARNSAQPSEPGTCFIYSGQTGQLMFELQGERRGDQFGSAVAATLGGQQKLIAIGAQNAGLNQRGRVYVYDLGSRPAELRFTIEGDQQSKDLGKMFVGFPGDFNQDGVPDVYASDFSDSTAAAGGGKVRVVSGKDGALLLSLTGAQKGEGLGTSPSDVGDINGDGIPDLAVGAWQNAEGAPSGGKVTVYSGHDGRVIRSFTCLQPGDTFGFDSVGLGDINRDGHTDFLCTSAWSPVLGPRTGRVLVISGAPADEGAQR